MAIFPIPPKSRELESRLTRLDELRRYLARHLGESAQPWTGTLRRRAAAAVPDLVSESATWLESGDVSRHPVVRAAMAHLNLVSIHPFRDGNGRLARVVQSLVLAKEGLLRPEFVSIEPYLGRHTREYFAVLEEVQGAAFDPTRDVSSWVEFCIDAHVAEATDREQWVRIAYARHDFCTRLATEHGYPERFVVALDQALLGLPVTNADYRCAADTASPAGDVATGRGHSDSDRNVWAGTRRPPRPRSDGLSQSYPERSDGPEHHGQLRADAEHIADPALRGARSQRQCQLQHGRGRGGGWLRQSENNICPDARTHGWLQRHGTDTGFRARCGRQGLFCRRRRRRAESVTQRANRESGNFPTDLRSANAVFCCQSGCQPAPGGCFDGAAQPSVRLQWQPRRW